MTVGLPELHSERLRLVPATLEHLPHLSALNADPEVMRYLTGRPTTEAETADEWTERRRFRSDPSRGLGYWVGFLRADETFAGWWGLGVTPGEDGVAHLGYRLPRAVWGRGLATEGCHTLVDHAFGTLGLVRVWASSMAVNTGSRRVLERLGFTETETWVQRWDDPVEGWEQGEVRYDLTP
ncbi:GNAT family N-acetyltransferase [Nocardioides sp. CFH 31398]|uniref:GNAT family N-acetyltransferase n=1 Tax=Nocardioides sp. CFH 31398 TaxID=2919579 RepID=UPI001F068941|nr:GNAT family N-acetyltransferase [Nocardioides sp. CFH 31398]MCH1865265.1 GNAT family N-acetyltransferase [Nocardioides sp. CFH 31398]